MRKIVLEKLIALITAAFGLVAALAWNDAIKALILRIFGERESLLAMFVYALFVTVIAVVVTLYLGKIIEYNERKFLKAIKLIQGKKK